MRNKKIKKLRKNIEGVKETTYGIKRQGFKTVGHYVDKFGIEYPITQKCCTLVLNPECKKYKIKQLKRSI